jgi:hypothetical protein
MASIDLLYEAIELDSTTTIQGVFFGINISLYFLCTQLFYCQYRKSSPEEQRKFIFSFLCISLIVFVLEYQSVKCPRSPLLDLVTIFRYL